MFSNAQVLKALAGAETGGGVGYTPKVTGPKQTDVTVTSRSGFESHADDADKKIWIPGNATIRLTKSMVVRAEIYSDRGQDGSPGALLYTTERGSSSQAWDGGPARGLLIFRGKAKLSGVRYRGPYHDHYPNVEYPGYIPKDSGTYKERTAKRAARYARGINVQSQNIEIENCELYGWPVQAINIGDRSNAYSAEIHHCYGHDCMMVGFGYVVDCMRGTADCHDNYFNATRHSLVGFGHEDCNLHSRRDVYGPSTYSHAFDMHCLSENGYADNTNPSSSTWRGRAGGTISVKNCVFLYRRDITGSAQEGVVIRGVPKVRCAVEGNAFPHPSAPRRNPGSSQGDAWRQSNLSSFNVSTDSRGYANFAYRNNDFGLRKITLPAGVVVGPGEEPIEVDRSPPRLATRQTNRRGKAQAARGIADALSD